MFSTYFEWTVKPGTEAEFVEFWTTGTEALRLAGSFGSALFIGEDGNYRAFARWPDRETRDRAFAKNIAHDNGDRFRDCILEEIRRDDLEQVVNLWVT